ncbi:integral membrane protein [Coprinopsis cinerea AmutBmut pab1-1]|nr:integral membrane protein [Coprinopsis cinerea AmutBmut pab1-1]
MPNTDHDNPKRWLKSLGSVLPSEPNHPTRIALRAYGLALTLSLGPALIPFVTKPLFSRGRKVISIAKFFDVLKRELRHDGFAFAITTAVAGGPVLRTLWKKALDAEERDDAAVVTEQNRQRTYCQQSYSRLKALLKTLETASNQMLFLTNALATLVGFLLLRSGRERQQIANRARSRRKVTGLHSFPTLDFTLFLVVRALDAKVQGFIHDRFSTDPRPTDKPGDATLESTSQKALSSPNRISKHARQLSMQVDAFAFWLCSSRIMWCYFYEPYRLPGSYVKWITALANVDDRLFEALRLIRAKKWSYISGSKEHSEMLQGFAKDLGYPASWGDPALLPAYGGAAANEAWKSLGVTTRPGVGGIPCELVHAEFGKSMGLASSCHANAALRGAKGFMQALAIYIPAHFIPVLLTRPGSLLQLSRVLQTTGAALRSSAFLSTFLALYFYTVCFTRTMVLAKLLPFISHQFWDGPYGCLFAGSLACGTSIWVENGRRRGEMALYVLPRALRTCLPQNLSKKSLPFARLAESFAFVASMSVLLQAGSKRPDSLRGLSRWALDFVLNGRESGKGDTTAERGI